MSKIPYSDVLGNRDAAVVIAETPHRLFSVFDKLSAEELDQSPAPNKWSLREIMCHLADCELVWGWRLRYAYEKDCAELQPFEQDPWAKMYSNYTYAQARATFAALRAWNIAFVSGLSDSEREKPYLHPVRGMEKLWNLVEIMAGHDLHHLKSLEAR